MSNTEPGSRRDNRGGETTAHHDESTLADARSLPGGDAAPRVEPQLPHERDESSSSQASASAQHGPIGQQALADTLGPSVDTDRGPVLDRIYNESVAPRDADTPPRR